MTSQKECFLENVALKGV